MVFSKPKDTYETAAKWFREIYIPEIADQSQRTNPKISIGDKYVNDNVTFNDVEKVINIFNAANDPNITGQVSIYQKDILDLYNRYKITNAMLITFNAKKTDYYFDTVFLRDHYIKKIAHYRDIRANIEQHRTMLSDKISQLKTLKTLFDNAKAEYEKKWNDDSKDNMDKAEKEYYKAYEEIRRMKSDIEDVTANIDINTWIPMNLEKIKKCNDIIRFMNEYHANPNPISTSNLYNMITSINKDTADINGTWGVLLGDGKNYANNEGIAYGKAEIIWSPPDTLTLASEATISGEETTGGKRNSKRRKSTKRRKSNKRRKSMKRR